MSDYSELKRILKKKSATKHELGSAMYEAREQYKNWDTISQGWDLYYQKEIKQMGFEKAHDKCSKKANKETSKWFSLYQDLQFRYDYGYNK